MPHPPPGPMPPPDQPPGPWDPPGPHQPPRLPAALQASLLYPGMLSWHAEETVTRCGHGRVSSIA